MMNPAPAAIVEPAGPHGITAAHVGAALLRLGVSEAWLSAAVGIVETVRAQARLEARAAWSAAWAAEAEAIAAPDVAWFHDDATATAEAARVAAVLDRIRIADLLRKATASG